MATTPTCGTCGMPSQPMQGACKRCGAMIRSVQPAPRMLSRLPTLFARAAPLRPGAVPRSPMTGPSSAPANGLLAQGNPVGGTARATTVAGDVGVVRSAPSSHPVGFGPERALGVLAMVLLALLVLTTPHLFAGFVVVGLVLLLLIAVPMWLLSKVGALGLVTLAGRARRQPLGTTELVFRWEPPSGVRQVRLRGHQHGVALGDAVAIHGWSHRGTLEVARVHNLTTGAILWRAGLGRLILALMLDLLLLLVLAAHLVGAA